MTITAAVALGLSQPADHDPAALAIVQPVLDRLAADAQLRTDLSFQLLSLISAPMPTITKEIEAQFASWPTGTMDFVIAPLPIDDQVHTVSKIIALWGLPRPSEIQAAGMKHALLAWSGGAESLDDFVRGFASLGSAGQAPTDEAISPLVELVYSLRAPQNPTPPDPVIAARGETLFTEKGCASCHDGPRGSGKRAYTFDEIGTDRAMALWADPDQDGVPCCGLAVAPGGLTHGIKSPRLVGTWAQGRFLHNGALPDLESLFCLGKQREPIGVVPNRRDGHAMTCDGLTDDDKRALIAFLLAH